MGLGLKRVMIEEEASRQRPRRAWQHIHFVAQRCLLVGLASEPEAVEENKRGDRSPDNSGCGWDISFSLGDAVSRLASHRPCKSSEQTRPAESPNLWGMLLHDYA